MARTKKINLRDVFAEFKEARNVEDETLKAVIEDVFRNALKKIYGTADNFDIIVNPQHGDLEIWRNREVVPDDEFTDPNTQIKLSEAKKIDEDYEVGEEVSEEVDINSFGRRTILSIKQSLYSKLVQLQRDAVYKKYKEKLGQIIAAEVYQIWRNNILLLDEEGNELLLPREEMIPNEQFHKGDTVRGVVHRVEMKNNIPEIIISRSSPVFLQRLFEQGVPEIEDGIIIIKKIVRKPGKRAKVAVESVDERIDPVGACVGMRGSRIQGIVKELRNENIDVINYTKNTALLIQRALSPAKIDSIEINEEEKTAKVYVKPEEVGKALGKGAVNVDLAQELTGYKIDVYRIVDSYEEDISIDVLADKIDEDILQVFVDNGIETLQAIDEYSTEQLEKMLDLEVETIEEIKRLAKQYLEENKN